MAPRLRPDLLGSLQRFPRLRWINGRERDWMEEMKKEARGERGGREIKDSILLRSPAYANATKSRKEAVVWCYCVVDELQF